jgi:transposase
VNFSKLGFTIHGEGAIYYSMSHTRLDQPSELELARQTLFEIPAKAADEPTAGAEGPPPKPRVQRAQRDQMEWLPMALDDLIPADHEARSVWEFVGKMNLSPLYERIAAVEGQPGRSPIDPKILMTLWLYATIRGVGSARQLDELCRHHSAYRWICGGVSVNYHTLADFRTQHAALLNQLLTDSVASLLSAGLIELNRVAQDGMRVRASAGSSSFRRRPTLEECQAEAQAQVAALQAELEEADSAASSRRQQAARKRAAREKAERVQQALEEMAKLEVQKESRQKGSKEKARTSTTDPEARKMKMADGGFRPAYNLQFSTTTDTQVIVGVDVTNSGNDGGLMAPMNGQIHERYGKSPDETIVDGGFSTLKDIETLTTAEDGTTVYAPVKDEEKKRTKGEDPFAALPGDTAAIAAWRQRMGTAEAKEIYKERAATAECVNAIARNRNLWFIRVRGLVKARAVALWYALAHNLRRALALCAEAEKLSLAAAN